ncbi:MAG: acetyl-CoA C-acetyltransferase [bacterium]|nr:acetyl-CoA C-acetyltransferase [bacterium]
MREVVIASAARTPIGSFGGAFKEVSAIQLGVVAVKAALERANLRPDQVEDVLLGNILQAGLGQGPARQVALGAGIPAAVPATTVNKLCGSGLEAINLAIRAVRLGDADIVVAGGMENMSQAPYVMPGARWGARMGHAQILDTMISDGLTCAFNHYHMGVTAENVAARHDLDRAAQDAYAAESQRRAAAAQAAGRFDAEIAPVSIPQRKGDPVVVSRDEYLKPDTTVEGLAKLRPAFKPDGGTVTAGNASGINDGAAAVVIMSADKARELGITPLATVVTYDSAGVDPAVMGLGPVPTVRKILTKAGTSLDQVDLVEFNEAFAAQALGVMKELGADPERTNVNGGAIALGHPVGASGARILVTLLYEMGRRDAKTGLASLCIGGGMGVGLLVRR